jgi:acetyl esterase/lipase
MENLIDTRIQFEELGNIYPKETSVKVTPVLINEVSCYWFTPENAIPNKIIVYLHGGAYVLGSIRSHESMVTHISKKLRTNILFIEYALAPEKPYPAGINDVLAVYKELTVTHPGYTIDFIGDSAGAGLLLSATNKMLHQQLPLPRATVMISPWINLDCDNHSYEENAQKDPILSKENLQNRANMYTGNIPLEQSNPHHIPFNNFPPVLIMVGTNEILLDDSSAFYSNIQDKQEKTRLTIYEDQYHVWPLSDIYSEASQNALTEIEAFLNG